MASIAPEKVSEHAAAVTNGCGQPIRMARADGSVDWGIHRCEHRACERCQRVYSSEVTAAIENTLAGEEKLAHLTLTQAPWMQGTHARASEACERALRDHWRAAVDMANRLIHANRKLDYWSSAPREHPTGLVRYWHGYWLDVLTGRGDAPGLRQRLRSEVGGKWAQTDFLEHRRPLTYLWQKECELNENSHFHWHFHVAAPDRQTAELLNAAWQATRTQKRRCQTHISAADDRRDTAPPDAQLDWDDPEDLAQELGHYLSGTRSGAFLEDASKAEIVSYFKGLEDTCLYGAGGRWRPVGVAEQRESGDEKADVVAVAWADSTRWFSWEEWWGSGKKAAQIAGGEEIARVPSQIVRRDESASDWTAARRIRNLLEQHRNFFSNPSAAWAVYELESSGLDPPDDLEHYVEDV